MRKFVKDKKEESHLIHLSRELQNFLKILKRNLQKFSLSYNLGQRRWLAWGNFLLKLFLILVLIIIQSILHQPGHQTNHRMSSSQFPTWYIQFCWKKPFEASWAVLRSLSGYDKPKQFCKSVGTSAPFWCGLKDLFPLHKLDDQVILDH